MVFAKISFVFFFLFYYTSAEFQGEYILSSMPIQLDKNQRLQPLFFNVVKKIACPYASLFADENGARNPSKQIIWIWMEQSNNEDGERSN